MAGVLGSLGPWVQVERFVVPRHVALGTNVSLECDYQVQQHATLYSLKWYKGSSQFYQYIPSKTEPHAVFSVPGLHQNQLGLHQNKLVGKAQVNQCIPLTSR
ncbi:hypothetical protein Pcinc_029032 [Petrolisthes cinctipes]|uniref:Ig-like domain-containing protein n=1 Tax=Petrolisthes cinctipes TaxID=88211 RepID=A0AAE1K861_PETCI|nr:hypothetical protein Pcinc_029032 [Petrolisthes cinctipes]